MFIHYRTQGIILKKTDRGEADQLLTVYTKDFGKIEILARAVRKIASKLHSSADIFYLSEIEFVQGKTHKTLTDAILIDKFSALRNDLAKLRIAYKISEIADNLIKVPEADPKIWNLMTETFSRLDDWKTKNSSDTVILQKSSIKLEIVYYYFFWHLVSLLGYQPKIENCTLQGKKIDCDIVKIIKLIFKKDWNILRRLKLTSEHFKLLKRVSEWYRVKICD